MDLFTSTTENFSPLADRMRPTRFSEMVGQQHLVGTDGILPKAIQNKSLHSFILWGPPGTGKTTLAKILATESNLEFIPFSAVLASIKEVKEVMLRASKIKKIHGKPTLVFVDEIHRFNKAQQDAFLPYVERGDIILVGATTENPSFEVVNALLSRVRVYLLYEFTNEQLVDVLKRALMHDEILKKKNIECSEQILSMIASKANGDARAALTILEAIVSITKDGKITQENVIQVVQKQQLYYDQNGEELYNIISALHRSMRKSD